MKQSTLDQLQAQLQYISDKEKLIQHHAELRDLLHSEFGMVQATLGEQIAIDELREEIKEHKRTFNKLLNQLTPFLVNVAQKLT